jgi:hypothetical protein
MRELLGRPVDSAWLETQLDREPPKRPKTMKTKTYNRLLPR